MKKLLLAAILLGTLNCALAQTESVYYYYQGKKFFVPVNYHQLVIGIKSETSFYNNKTALAEQLSLPADSVKPTANKNEFIVRLTGQSYASDKAFANSISTKNFVTYVHACLSGQGSRQVSYGDAFIVKLRQGVLPAQLTSLTSKYHCSLIKTSLGDRNTWLISSGEQNGYDALKMANAFFESGFFEFAEPDFTTYGGLTDAPNDPLYNLQWAQHNTGSAEQYNGTPGADMQVDSAWTITKGDSSIKIAVIDTGVDTAQADLKKNLLQGFDCITQTANPGDGAPKNLSVAHGTAVAGIIAAVADNSIGIAGIAPKCKIIPVNISDESGFFTSEFGIAAGIDYSWQNGADVLNNSWTLGLPSGAIDGAIHRAITQGRSGKGCIIFFGAGNDYAGIAYPSYNPEVIAVGGSNMFNRHKTTTSGDGEYWWGASYGNGLDIVAPCVKIATTDISGSNGYNTADGSNGDYNLTFNGTSAASPHAAAVAALVLSVNKNLTAAEARTVIESNCTKPTYYTFGLTADNVNGTWNNEMGYGIVNAYKSVLAAQSKKFCNVGIVAPASTLLCKNASLKLGVADSSIAGAVYTWHLNAAVFETGKSIITSTPGTYDVQADFANGCTAYAADITLYAADTATLYADAGGAVSLCPGSNGAIIGGAPSAAGGSGFVASQRAYGFDLLHSSYIRFNTNNPRDYTYIPVGTLDGVTNTYFIAGDFTPLGYYAVTQDGILARIDTATGYTRLIGQLITPAGQYVSHKWCGLTWSPATKKLYGNTNGGLANGLYEIDPITAKAVVTGYINSSAMAWVTFNNSGTLYGFNTSYNNIVRIDSGSGGTFLSQDIGIRLTTNLDGGFDPLNGKLYMSTYSYGQGLFGDLREIDTLTWRIAVKGGIGAISEVGALAISGKTYQYAWAPASGLSNANDANPVANPLSTTTYTLTVTDACGAKAASKVVVTANAAKPAVKITADKDSICIGDSSRLSVTKNGNYTYQWLYNGEAVNNPNDTFYNSSRGGNFQVSVTNGRGGCANTSAVFKLKDCSIWLNNDSPDTACYKYFYPPHGFADTGFKPGETFTKTIYPASKGDMLRITFNNFYANSVFTHLYIYDGPNTTYPLLKMFSYLDYSGVTSTYTASNGPLTIQLVTGGQTDNIGTWDAFLTCYTPHVYRSKHSGNLEDSSTWEIKTGANTWADALTTPAYFDDSIIIRSGHTVTLSNYFIKRLDQVWVQKGANLVLNNGLALNNSGSFLMVADGDLILNSYGQLNADGKIVIRGNITAATSNNSVSGIFYADGTAGQTFSFSGGYITSLHVLNKNGFTLHGFARIDTLVMSTKGRIQTDSLFIRRKLQLDSGIIDVKAPGVFDLSNIDLIYATGNPNSYINGPVTMAPYSNANLSMYYPTGTNIAYRPLVITMDKFVNDLYTVQAFNQPPPVLPLPQGINRVSNSNYFSIQALRNYPFVNATVTLPYINSDGVNDPANLRIVRDSASQWVNAGGVGSHIDTGTISSTNKITALHYLALANATGGTNTLPVNWLQFIVTPQNKYTLLQWTVAHEINCAYYMAEHSTDATHFTALAQIPATNNGGNINTYQYLHTAILTGINYYRIKEVDKDGRFTYSKTVTVNIDDVNSLQVTPNPTRDVVTITSARIINEIDCYNALGQLIKKILPAANNYKLSLSQLPAGVYTIHVVTETAAYNRKVVKE